MVKISFFTSLIVLSTFLGSCSSKEYNKITLSNTGSSNSITHSGSSVVPPSINWKEEIIFSECKTIKSEESNFLTGELNILQSKLQEYIAKHGETSPSWKPRIGNFLKEYCKSTDGKYIFISDDKVPSSLGRYDANLGVIEEATWKHQYISHFPGYKDFFHGRSGSIISIKSNIENYRESERYIFLKNPLKEKNQKFCSNGLLSNGKPSECSIDIEFEYNYQTNILSEYSFCSFYRDENGKKQVLEKCLILPPK